MARKVLIAEDNDQLGAVLEQMLQRSGFETDRARDGIQALSHIATSRPDALLLDLRLPKLHGVELLKKVRKSPVTRGLPVVAMSGVYRGERYVQALRALGVRHFLEKPFKGAQLLGALQALLQPAPPAEAAPIDQHLLQAFRNRFTGTLRLRREGSEHFLVFFNGVPTALRPGFTHPDFGRYLLRRELISEEEYRYYADPGQGRAESLVSLGCLEYPDLLQEKLVYLKEELIDAFALPLIAAGEEPLPCPPASPPLTMNLPQLLLLGYRRTHRQESYQNLLKAKGSQYVAATPDYFRHVNFLHLDDEEKQLLNCLSGKTTLGQILQGWEQGTPLLRTLCALDMVRLSSEPAIAATPSDLPLRTLFNRPEEVQADIGSETLETFSDLVDDQVEATDLPLDAPAPSEDPTESDLGLGIRQALGALEGKDYYQIFGLSQGNCSMDRLKERYFELTRQFGPDTLMRLSGEDAAAAQDLLSAVTNAYNTLSDVVKKERYDELLGADKIGLGQKGDERFQAKVQYQSGKVFIEMEEWDNAQQALQDACNIDPDNGHYLAHLAWATYRNPQNATSRAMQDKARQLLNRALTLERSAEGHAFKGWILLEGAQDSLAEAEFTKALKLDARQVLARKGLHTIQEKQEQEKKGLFRRIFR